jgi:signal transduction histidine kinase
MNSSVLASGAGLREFGFPKGSEAATERQPAEAEAAWKQHRHDTGIRNWRYMLFWSGALTALWWPTDLFIFAGQPDVQRAFVFARGTAIVCCFVAVFLVPRVPLFALSPFLWMGTFGWIVCFQAGYQYGLLGGPGGIWFHFTHMLVLTPIAVSFSFRQRLAVTLSFAAALVLGYFCLHPAHFSEPGALATLNFLAFVTLVSVAGGAYADVQRREMFFLRERAARQADALKEWSAQLDRRVKEQTAELRDLTIRRETLLEEERARISRELHDELGQELTALTYAMELIRTRLRRGSTKVESNVEGAVALIARTRQTVRDIVADLRPRVLDDLGLGPAIDWLVQRLRERTELDVRLDLPDGEPTVRDEVATAAFRIAQESLTNIAKHAKARQVEVCVRSRDGHLEITVQDDGVGLTPDACDGTGMGLIGMRERAQSVGGTVEILGTAGRGTLLRARLPFDARGAA